MKNKEKQGKWNRYTVHYLRNHMGMTQQEMAQELGIRQQTISDWETGMYRPRGPSNTLLNIIAERTGFTYESENEQSKNNPGIKSENSQL